MKKQNDFLTREEALAVLGVKVATLYSYVSRGLIRSVPVAGTKRHLYASDDVQRFAARGRGRLPRSVTAGTSMRWENLSLPHRLPLSTSAAPSIATAARSIWHRRARRSRSLRIF
ncbi:helix-turn-helix domain-containing protein [Pandoraea sp. XY-2]|uniref:helix-turn-helix domain-containing protein n=1 Tax=Pandoraea sp. XY-2 TaxID=2518599 RepID=UPI001F0DBC91|nr:helix-turn-helix domain-containing protein [Pandoraea sp. XY-2]